MREGDDEFFRALGEVQKDVSIALVDEVAVDAIGPHAAADPVTRLEAERRVRGPIVSRHLEANRRRPIAGPEHLHHVVSGHAQ